MNLIFFVPDEMRAESVGCYGHPLVRTPNIDRFAAEGVRFEQCHVQNPVCSPSRCSFMTGWYPHVAGHRTLWNLLGPEEPSLLRSLKQAGYGVYWAGKNDLLSPAALARDVTDHHLERRSTRRTRETPASADPRDPLHRAFLWPSQVQSIESLSDFACVDGGIEFLRSKPQEPFILYLPLQFPHCPYWTPPAFANTVDRSALPALRPSGLPNKPDFHELIRQYRGLDRLDESVLREVQARYLEMISVTDHLFGELLSALGDTGLDRTTSVFFFADHGDYAGDYGLVEKWPSGFEDVLTRVPLIVRTPSCSRGHVVREPMELFDVMATALELADVRAEHTHFAQSFVPELAGAAGDPTRAVFAEGGYDRHESHCFEGRGGSEQEHRYFADPDNVYAPKILQQLEHPESVCRSVMIRTATHKLIHRPGGQSELYDLVADPRELSNLYGTSSASTVQAELERRLLDWYVHTADAVSRDQHPRGLD